MKLNSSGENASRERDRTFTRRHPRLVRRSSQSEGGRRVAQYPRDSSDGAEKPRHTGFPVGACHPVGRRPDRVAGNDDVGRSSNPMFAGRVAPATFH